MERRPPTERGAVQSLDAYHFYTEDWDDYDQLCDAFEWEIPERFNLAEYLCDRWAARRGRVAVFGETHRGSETTYTYWQLRNDSNRLATVLRQQGIGRGDRIGINLLQRPETLVAHLAAWKLGASSVPLSTKFGPKALAYRLDDCGAKACFVDTMNAEAFSEARDELSDLDEVITVGGGDHRGIGVSFQEVLTGASRNFDPVEQVPSDEALIHYTSGTTGEPKGVRHGHQVVLGHLPTFVTTFCNMELSDDHLFWTPSEWAWILLPMMILPNLFYGKPLLAYSAPRFEPTAAYRLLETYGVTNYFAPPTALRMMASEGTADQYDTGALRVVASAGEPVGQELKEWVAEAFDAPVQEAYGQTEVDSVAGTCTALDAVREGTIGKVTPGRTVRIVDPEDPPTSVDPSEIGEFAVHRTGDPICFLDYLNRPEQTAQKVQDGWILLGDLGREDEDGYLSFNGRMDDVIISSGYRIGPSEIEDTLATHSAVADAGVIGIPDDKRGEVPKAFVVLQGDADPSEDLVQDLQQYVKERLAVYEYPREIEFIDSLPMTVTDKVRRADLRAYDGRSDEEWDG